MQKELFLKPAVCNQPTFRLPTLSLVFCGSRSIAASKDSLLVNSDLSAGRSQLTNGNCYANSPKDELSSQDWRAAVQTERGALPRLPERSWSCAMPPWLTPPLLWRNPPQHSLRTLTDPTPSEDDAGSVEHRYIKSVSLRSCSGMLPASTGKNKFWLLGQDRDGRTAFFPDQRI